MNSLLVTTNKPYTYDIFLSDLSRLLIKFPFIKKETIGYSVLGKPIYALKLGTGNQKIIITAAHHAKEWITSTLVMCLINTLCDNSPSNKTFYFVPMVNPDGVNLCIKGLSQDLPAYVRNRLITINSSEDFIGKWQANIRGIDLNHNYDASFSKGKAIQLKEGIFAPAPTKYSGEYPESEPETKAMANLLRVLNPIVLISLHSQGKEVFYQPKNQRVERIGKRIADAIGYELSEPSELALYGGLSDYAGAHLGIPSFTIEVGKGENPLPLSALGGISEKLRQLFVSLPFYM